MEEINGKGGRCMLSNIVTIGDKIDLVKLMSSHENLEKPKQYLSKVLDLIDNMNAKIAMPMDHARIIPLEIGDKYQFYIYTKKGLYQCRGVITNRYKEEALYILEVQFTSDLEKYQRREYYRLSCILDIEYRPVTEEELRLTKELNKTEFHNDEEKQQIFDRLDSLQSAWIPAVISEVSGGGARFNSRMIHEKGDIIKISITFHMHERIEDYELKAKVISSGLISNRSGLYENRVEFSEIEQEQRETIIKFVFEEERKLIRRERAYRT